MHQEIVISINFGQRACRAPGLTFLKRMPATWDRVMRRADNAIDASWCARCFIYSCHGGLKLPSRLLVTADMAETAVVHLNFGVLSRLGTSSAIIVSANSVEFMWSHLPHQTTTHGLGAMKRRFR
jgi:hypothetical protein